MNEITPTDWHNTRIADSMGENFIKFEITHRLRSGGKRQELLDWLQKYTTGRYFIGEVLEHKIIVLGTTYIGFEEEADATFYSLTHP